MIGLTEGSSGIPSLDDFHELKSKIYHFIQESGHPVTVAEIAKHIERDEKTTGEYCLFVL